MTGDRILQIEYTRQMTYQPVGDRIGFENEDVNAAADVNTVQCRERPSGSRVLAAILACELAPVELQSR